MTRRRNGRHRKGTREPGTTADLKDKRPRKTAPDRYKMETDGQEGLKNKREKQHLPEGLENPVRNRHKGQAASGEEEEAPKRTPKAGRGRRRDYLGRGGMPRLHETWKAEPRTSQLVREQSRLESRRGNTDETGSKIRCNSQGAEERPSVGPTWKVVEAPRQNHREP